MATLSVNATEIRVVGMSRSGNHAIIDWILAQSAGRTCFLNCAEVGTNPFQSARPLGPGPQTTVHRVSYEAFEIEAERRGRLSRKDLLIHSYEDTYLGRFAHPDTEARHDADVGRSSRRIDLLVLRDPRNLFASRLASGFGWLSDELVVRVWCQHAREFLGLRRNLRQERLMVSYNAWVTSPAYRRMVANALDLRFDDSAGHAVSSVAGGSSFDGTSYHGRAREMPVLDRWHAYADDRRFRRLLTPAVLELSYRIFGPVAVPQRIAPLAAA